MALSLEDRVAIGDLYSRFAFAIDSSDADAWLSSFTEDATFIGRDTWVGHDGIKQMIAATIATVETRPMQRAQHHFYNLVVDGDGTTAKASCYLTWTGDNSGTISSPMLAVYVDELAKVDGAWKFARKEIRYDVPRLSALGL
jgi:uncharacterized protein (TIGR02246 family)